MTQPISDNAPSPRTRLTLDASRDEIFSELSNTIAELFEIDAADIALESDLRKDLGLDSIDAVDMAVRLQQLTGKKVPLSDLLSICTLSDVIDVVQRHLTTLKAEGANSLPSEPVS